MHSLIVLSFEHIAIMNWCHIYYTISIILVSTVDMVLPLNIMSLYIAPNEIPFPPTDLPCHNLSFYVADYTSFFTNDTIFYFLEGTHILQGTLNISNVSNITLQGLGHIE